MAIVKGRDLDLLDRDEQQKAIEAIARNVQTGSVELDELPKSIRNRVMEVMVSPREEEDEHDKISTTSKAVSSKPKAAKKAGTKKAAAKAKK